MPRDRAGLVFATAALALAPFAIGGAARWAACMVAAIAVASAALFVTSRRELSERSPLLVFLGLAALFTLLQIIPFPAELTGLLSPAKRQLVVDNAAALGTTPARFIPLSMDPPATALELAKLLGYLAFAYTCLRLTASQRQRRILPLALVGVGTAMAATALLHHVVGADELFGVYAPRYIEPPPYMAPLLNPNHLAGLMALLAPVALGLAFTLSPRYRALSLAAALMMSAVALLTQSRGGAVALVLGLSTAGALLVLHRRRGALAGRKLALSTAIPIGIVALCALVLVGVLSAGGVAEELLGTTTNELGEQSSKFGAWRASTTLLNDHAWAGVGRGAFEASFPQVHSMGDARLYSHLENEYLQAAVDWGIPAAAALALAFIAVNLAAFRRFRAGQLEAGLFGGLVAIATHNLVDFSLSLPGVAIPAICALALLIGADNKLRGTPSLRIRILRGGLVGAGVLAVALASSPHGRTARAEADALRPVGEVENAVRAFARHPSDYMIAGLLAKALYAQRDPRAVGAINRALALNPGHPGLHLLAAQLLSSSQQPDQALVEYALALELQPSVDTLSEMLSRFPRTEQAVRGLPVTRPSLRRLGHRVKNLGGPELALAYGKRLTQRFPRDGASHRYVANNARELGDHELALSAAKLAASLEPGARSAMTLAQALAASGQLDDALATLRDAIEKPSGGLSRAEHIKLLTTTASLAQRAGNPDVARAALHDALAIAGTDRRAAAALHRQLAVVEQAAGNAHQADWERARADELVGKD